MYEIIFRKIFNQNRTIRKKGFVLSKVKPRISEKPNKNGWLLFTVSFIWEKCDIIDTFSSPKNVFRLTYSFCYLILWHGYHLNFTEENNWKLRYLVTSSRSQKSCVIAEIQVQILWYKSRILWYICLKEKVLIRGLRKDILASYYQLFFAVFKYEFK